jgi:hypothetical protein
MPPRQANFEVVSIDPEWLTIQDVGPWDQHPSVTNDVEGVVDRLSNILGTRRLRYYDSEGELDEIVVRDGKFAHFKPIRDEAGDVVGREDE